MHTAAPSSAGRAAQCMPWLSLLAGRCRAGGSRHHIRRQLLQHQPKPRHQCWAQPLTAQALAWRGPLGAGGLLKPNHASSRVCATCKHLAHKSALCKVFHCTYRKISKKFSHRSRQAPFISSLLRLRFLSEGTEPGAEGGGGGAVPDPGAARGARTHAGTRRLRVPAADKSGARRPARRVTGIASAAGLQGGRGKRLHAGDEVSLRAGTDKGQQQAATGYF